MSEYGDDETSEAETNEDVGEENNEDLDDENEENESEFEPSETEDASQDGESFVPDVNLGASPDITSGFNPDNNPDNSGDPGPKVRSYQENTPTGSDEPPEQDENPPPPIPNNDDKKDDITMLDGDDKWGLPTSPNPNGKREDREAVEKVCRI